VTNNGRRFAWLLGAIAVAGLALRVAYVLIERRDFMFEGDAVFYHQGANLLADGHGFISPFELADSGKMVEAADHPPLYLVWLAAPSFVGFDTELSHLLWSCLLGAASVALVGLLGREVAGARVGLLAAVLAAVYPNLWWHDGALMAETMAIFTATLAVLLAYRYRTSPTTGQAIALGVACALATLTRAELALLVPLVVVPIVFSRSRVAEVPARAPGQHENLGRSVLRPLAIPVLAFGVTLAPWVGHNLARFDRPVLVSTGFELTLNISSCDDTYYGPFTGYLSIECARPTALRARAQGLDQSEEAARHRRKALDYILDHEARAPVVVAARWARVAGIYRLDQTVDVGRVEGREPWVSRLALVTLWPTMVLAAAGAVVLRRRRTPIYPLVALIAVVLVTVALSYGAQRFRASAEPALVVLAAVAIDGGLRRVQTRQ
jgi:hypothetical protein